MYIYISADLRASFSFSERIKTAVPVIYLITPVRNDREYESHHMTRDNSIFVFLRQRVIDNGIS